MRYRLARAAGAGGWGGAGFPAAVVESRANGYKGPEGKVQEKVQESTMTPEAKA